MSNQITLLSGMHVLFLSVSTVTAIVLAVILSKKIGFKKIVVWICLVIGLLCELEKIMFFMEDTGFGYRLPAEHIPFNLCTFQIFLIFFLAIAEDVSKRKTLIAYMYPTMLVGGFFGMLLPSIIFLGYHGVFDFATYRYFIYHAMVVFMGFYLYLSKPIEFTIKSYGMSLACLSLMTFVFIWLNAFFGWDNTVNFWFLARPPAPDLPIINVKYGWSGYMLQLMFLAVVLVGLCYIREIIRDTPQLIRSIGARLKRK